jgi:WD40 repeat protein
MNESHVGVLEFMCALSKKLVTCSLLACLLRCTSFFCGIEQGHVGCVNAIAWNSSGSLLVSGSDDTRVSF